MSVIKWLQLPAEREEHGISSIRYNGMAAMGNIKYSGKNHVGPDRLAPYPLSRLSPDIQLIDMAKEIAEADDMLSIQATGKLRLLLEQMRGLQDEARTILE